MTRVGVVFRPQSPPEQLVDAARAAEAAGLDELWLWEDCFLESGLATAVAALAHTERLVVGVGLLPVPLRNVALTAMELATVDRLFPGRFLPAVGHGVLPWMEQVGARVASPLTLMREYLTALQRLLAGETVTTQGRYVHLDDVTLGWAAPHPTPVLMGAEGPRTLELSGELAAGTVLTSGTTPAEVRTALGRIATGRSRRTGAAPGPADPHPVVLYLPAVFGPDAEARLGAERARWGWADDAEVGVAGTPERVAAGIRPWLDSGVDTVVLQPPADGRPLADFIDAAGQVARLLREA